jgi:hypothetical protein
MSTPMEKATAYLSKLKADRVAAKAVSKKKALEAMAIKAREQGFRKAMEILGVNVASDVTSNNIKRESDQRHKRKRRDIRQMIVKELSYSGKAMTTQQIAKAIDYLPERTEAVLKRLENAGEIIQNRDGLWDVVVITGASPDSHTVAAG